MARLPQIRTEVDAKTTKMEKQIRAGFARAASSIDLNNFNLKGGGRSPLGRIRGELGEFDKSLAASNARVLAFGASAGSIFLVERAIRALVSSTVEVERELAQINTLLRLSSENLKTFGGELFDVARGTAQSFNTVATAANEFARQGLSVEETLKRTNDALILTRLSGLDAAKSVEVLTAAVNSFAASAISTDEIVNKFANVAAKFAISEADLSEAIRRVGSSASDAGISFDELIAIVTTAQQVTARGGSVIGNSFKTIFTRLQRTKVVSLLDALGIETRDGSGGLKSQIDLLKELANVYDTLEATQKAYVAEQVGGVFQINVLKAALGDLKKEYSFYDNALKTSLTTTDEAIRRNEELNQTLAALAAQGGASLQQAAAKIGDLVFAPGANQVLGVTNPVLEAFNKIDSESIGGKFINGFFKGIGKFVSGPGLVLLSAVFLKFFQQFSKFSADAFQEVLGLNTAKREQVNVEKAISDILRNNVDLTKAIKNNQLSVSQVEQKIVQALKEQTSLLQTQEAVSKRIAKNRATTGINFSNDGLIIKDIKKRGNNRAGGSVPAFAENYMAAQGGYRAGAIRQRNIPGEGRVTYNSREKVKRFAGMSQPAIMPPKSSDAGKNYKNSFISQNGFDPYAALGGIPNFANIQTKYGTATTGKTDPIDLSLFGKTLGRKIKASDIVSIEDLSGNKRGAGGPLYRAIANASKGKRGMFGYTLSQGRTPKGKDPLAPIKAKYPQIVRRVEMGGETHVSGDYGATVITLRNMRDLEKRQQEIVKLNDPAVLTLKNFAAGHVPNFAAGHVPNFAKLFSLKSGAVISPSKKYLFRGSSSASGESVGIDPIERKSYRSQGYEALTEKDLAELSKRKDMPFLKVLDPEGSLNDIMSFKENKNSEIGRALSRMYVTSTVPSNIKNKLQETQIAKGFAQTIPMAGIKGNPASFLQKELGSRYLIKGIGADSYGSNAIMESEAYDYMKNYGTETFERETLKQGNNPESVKRYVKLFKRIEKNPNKFFAQKRLALSEEMRVTGIMTKKGFKVISALGRDDKDDTPNGKTYKFSNPLTQDKTLFKSGAGSQEAARAAASSINSISPKFRKVGNVLGPDIGLTKDGGGFPIEFNASDKLGQSGSLANPFIKSGLAKVFESDIIADRVQRGTRLGERILNYPGSEMVRQARFRDFRKALEGFKQYDEISYNKILANLVRKGFYAQTGKGTTLKGKVASNYFKRRGFAQGLVPNFANPIASAIEREKSAGLSGSQIYVKQKSELKNNRNPFGVGVFNTRDEGSAAKEKSAMKMRGFAAGGYVPNFAQEEDSNSGLAFAGVAGTLQTVAFYMALVGKNAEKSAVATNKYVASQRAALKKSEELKAATQAKSQVDKKLTNITKARSNIDKQKADVDFQLAKNADKVAIQSDSVAKAQAAVESRKQKIEGLNPFGKGGKLKSAAQLEAERSTQAKLLAKEEASLRSNTEKLAKSKAEQAALNQKAVKISQNSFKLEGAAITAQAQDATISKAIVQEKQKILKRNNFQAKTAAKLASAGKTISQNAFGFGFGAQLLASQAAAFVPQDSKGGRATASGLEGLGSAASLGATGQLIGGAKGGAAGLVIGGLGVISSVAKQLSTKFPELQKAFEDASDGFTKFTNSSQSLLVLDEQINTLIKNNDGNKNAATINKLQGEFGKILGTLNSAERKRINSSIKLGKLQEELIKIGGEKSFEVSAAGFAAQREKVASVGLGGASGATGQSVGSRVAASLTTAVLAEFTTTFIESVFSLSIDPFQKKVEGARQKLGDNLFTFFNEAANSLKDVSELSDEQLNQAFVELTKNGTQNISREDFTKNFGTVLDLSSSQINALADAFFKELETAPADAGEALQKFSQGLIELRAGTSALVAQNKKELDIATKLNQTFATLTRQIELSNNAFSIAADIVQQEARFRGELSREELGTRVVAAKAGGADALAKTLEEQLSRATILGEARTSNDAALGGFKNFVRSQTLDLAGKAGAGVDSSSIVTPEEQLKARNKFTANLSKLVSSDGFDRANISNGQPDSSQIEQAINQFAKMQNLDPLSSEIQTLKLSVEKQIIDTRGKIIETNQIAQQNLRLAAQARWNKLIEEIAGLNKNFGGGVGAFESGLPNEIITNTKLALEQRNRAETSGGKARADLQVLSSVQDFLGGRGSLEGLSENDPTIKNIIAANAQSLEADFKEMTKMLRESGQGDLAKVLEKQVQAQGGFKQISETQVREKIGFGGGDKFTQGLIDTAKKSLSSEDKGLIAAFQEAKSLEELQATLTAQLNTNLLTLNKTLEGGGAGGGANLEILQGPLEKLTSSMDTLQTAITDARAGGGEGGASINFVINTGGPITPGTVEKAVDAVRQQLESLKDKVSTVASEAGITFAPKVAEMSWEARRNAGG
jgi:TP901 family phage tail tape measure protein